MKPKNLKYCDFGNITLKGKAWLLYQKSLKDGIALSEVLHDDYQKWQKRKNPKRA